MKKIITFLTFFIFVISCKSTGKVLVGNNSTNRVGEVVAKESFGVLYFDFNLKIVQFVMLGDRGKVFGEMEQKY